MSKLTQEVTWVPFAEGHPTEPEEYLVWGPNGAVSTLTWSGKEWLFEYGETAIPMQVGTHLTLTHWMPLPTPPTV